MPSLGFPNLSPGQIAYMRWLCVPRKERFPGTEQALARELGVSRTTLWRWRRSPDFAMGIYKLSRATFGEHMADILAILEQQAASGSYRHLRHYLRLIDSNIAFGPTTPPNSPCKEPQERRLISLDLL